MTKSFVDLDHVIAWVASVSPETAAAYDRLKAKFTHANADGTLTFGEIFGLATAAQAELMDLSAKFTAPGALKKEAVLAMIGGLFDALPVLPLPPTLFFLIPFRGVIRAWIRAQVIAAADSALQPLYDRFLHPGTTPSPPPALKVFPRTA